MFNRFSRPSTPVRPSASTRRIATVVSSVPDAINASSSTARFDAPPVPRISREPNSRPAIVSFDVDEPLARRASISATLHRRNHFQPCAIGQRGLPQRPRQHRPIHSHGNAFLRKSEALDQCGDRGLVVHLDILVVDYDLHRTPTKSASATGTPLSSPAIDSAVHGASRKPDRPCPAATKVRSSSLPTMGRLSG